MTVETNATLAGLHRAILEAPHDDALRLIAADYLDEHGDGARAEFVRTQCELLMLTNDRLPFAHSCGRVSPRRWEYDPDDQACPRCQMMARRVLLSKREEELLRVAAVQDWSGFPAYVTSWQWRRGFVDSITMGTSDFLRHAKTLFETSPITAVVLTDRRPRRHMLVGLPSGSIAWANDPRGDSLNGSTALLPACLYILLPDVAPHGSRGGLIGGSQLGWVLGIGQIRCAIFASSTDALAALSRACTRYGRRLAGLPEEVI